MSYDIHITRADHWTESTNKPIAMEELKNYFSGKSEFEYSKEFSITGPFSMTISGEFFIWSNEDVKVPFRYSEGMITISHADDEVIDKMKEVAAELNAIVQGEEGETY
ncbi:hypothetical protein [Paenibacillus sp. LHD-38]|uniref:hypothetical protein n=1 Tax=Paenibacillus sp. LHD-38 TaxID=3072143 RepID=UPI00281042B1|nr:hypothetical protein [Paenibacillus sp. LHD-38]MDQ8735781.1 hypothetical protein [Paenibacillus sp. LHD-38]